MDTQSKTSKKNTRVKSQTQINYVAFIDEKVEEDFESLNKQISKKLHDSIEKAIKELKKDPICGIKITKKLWPKIYKQKYEITNLWKYNLVDGWRLIYTIQSNEIIIVTIILEWFNHKQYERRFKY